jgi:hypothetical protein
MMLEPAYDVTTQTWFLDSHPGVEAKSLRELLEKLPKVRFGHKINGYYPNGFDPKKAAADEAAAKNLRNGRKSRGLKGITSKKSRIVIDDPLHQLDLPGGVVGLHAPAGDPLAVDVLAEGELPPGAS